MGGAALLAALVALAPMQVDAQMGPRAARGQTAGPRGAGVEMILRQKERLELTENQVKQLDQIRQEAVQRRTEHQAQMAELRSKVRSGQLERDSLWKQVEARRQVATAMQEAQRTRVEGVLNDAQKQKLEQWAGQARAFRMGRQSGQRGGQGFGPGMRGGFVPGMGGGTGAGMRGRFGPGMGQQGGPGQRGGRGMMRRGPGGGVGFGPPRDSIPQ
jgi:hypothetical protein